MIDLDLSHGRYALRDARDQDEAWMWPLQRDTFRPYVEPLFGWEEDVARYFFDKHWRRRSVVLVDEHPVGWLEVSVEERWLYLADIGLLPECRNQGLGTRMIQDVLDYANAHELTVELQVLVTNPAQRLYERMGFRPSHVKMYRPLKK